jgi:hypothetical protein
MLGGLFFLLSCAARCGPVHPASPLSVCQRCGVGQCARRWRAPHRCRGVTSPVLRKCWSVRCGADMASARLRIVLDQPSPAARPGRRVRGSCDARPLRPPASLESVAQPSALPGRWHALRTSARAPIMVAFLRVRQRLAQGYPPHPASRIPAASPTTTSQLQSSLPIRISKPKCLGIFRDGTLGLV